MITSTRVLNARLRIVALLGLLPLSASASINFYLNEEAMDNAIAATSLTLLGRETFSSVGLNESGITSGSIIAPGVPAGDDFPNGSNPTLGLTFQTNSMGSNPATPSPGGVIYAYGPNEAGGKTFITPDLMTQSLDVFVDPPAYRGMALALSFAVAIDSGSSVIIKVFDNNNNLLSTQTYSSAGLERVGIVSSDEALFRINIDASSGSADIADVALYVVPEPATTALFVSVFAFAFLAWRQRRK